MEVSSEHEAAQRLELKDLQPGNAPVPAWKWTPAQKHRAARKSAFLRALHEHGTIGMACKAAGISDVTILRWRGTYPAFDDAVSEFLLKVREQRVVDSLYQLTQKATEDPKFASAGGRAGEFLLRAWNPDTYAEKTKLDITTTVNGKIEVVHNVRDEMRASQQARLLRLQARTLDALPARTAPAPD